MKEKILLAIKTKAPNAKLSQKRLDALVATIEAKAGTDESAIDTHLDALNDLYPLTEIAKDDHIRSTLEGKLKATQQKDETPAQKAAREAAEAAALLDTDKDTPAWAKALIEQNKTLAQDLAAIKGEKVISTMKAKATEKLKEVPAAFWGKRAIPENDEALEAFVTEVTADYTTFKQEMTEQGLSVLSSPKTGVASGEQTKAVSSDIKAFAEKQAVAAKAGA